MWWNEQNSTELLSDFRKIWYLSYRFQRVWSYYPAKKKSSEFFLSCQLNSELMVSEISWAWTKMSIVPAKELHLNRRPSGEVLYTDSLAKSNHVLKNPISVWFWVKASQKRNAHKIGKVDGKQQTLTFWRSMKGVKWDWSLCILLICLVYRSKYLCPQLLYLPSVLKA